METIGRANDGGYIVHMTSGEHTIFSQLQDAMEGRAGFVWKDAYITADLSNSLQAIAYWIKLRFNISEMQHQLYRLCESMGEKEGD